MFNTLALRKRVMGDYYMQKNILRRIVLSMLVWCLPVQAFAAATWWNRLNPANIDWETVFTPRVGYPAVAVAGGTFASFLTYHIMKSLYGRKLELAELKARTREAHAESRGMERVLRAMARNKDAEQGDGQQSDKITLPDDPEAAKKRDREALARHNLNQDVTMFKLK